MSNGYLGWLDKVIAGEEVKILKQGEKFNAPVESLTREEEKHKPFKTVVMARTDRKHYVGEVGRRGDDFIYHFYVKDTTPKDFEDKLGDAFLRAYLHENRLKSSYVDEMRSWSVLATGFALNPMADEYAVFDVLDKSLS
jgi:hypothetical protein